MAHDSIGSVELAARFSARASLFARYGPSTGPRLALASSCERIRYATPFLPTEAFHGVGTMPLHSWLSIVGAAPQTGRFLQKRQFLRCQTARRAVDTQKGLRTILGGVRQPVRDDAIASFRLGTLRPSRPPKAPLSGLLHSFLGGVGTEIQGPVKTEYRRKQQTVCRSWTRLKPTEFLRDIRRKKRLGRKRLRGEVVARTGIEPVFQP